MKNKGKGLILLGLLLIAAALFLTAYNLYDEQRAGQSAMQAIDQLGDLLPPEAPHKTVTEPSGEQETLAFYDQTMLPDYVLCPDMEMPVETINGIDYIGVLRIPALELELPIISQWNYKNLKTAPCRYSGSAYLNNLIICAHNFASHFGNLKKLSEGTIATFTDMDGNVFTYNLVERETLQPTDVEAMESGDWDLTLFTCTVGGKTRVTIRFALEED
ncbi:MAG: sortase [Faecousia sp.]